MPRVEAKMSPLSRIAPLIVVLFPILIPVFAVIVPELLIRPSKIETAATTMPSLKTEMVPELTMPPWNVLTVVTWMPD